MHSSTPSRCIIWREIRYLPHPFVVRSEKKKFINPVHSYHIGAIVKKIRYQNPWWWRRPTAPQRCPPAHLYVWRDLNGDCATLVCMGQASMSVVNVYVGNQMQYRRIGGLRSCWGLNLRRWLPDRKLFRVGFVWRGIDQARSWTR